MRAPGFSHRPEELLSDETNEEPHAFLARIRAEHAIARVEGTGVHLVLTWELIEEALGREADFSANLTGFVLRGEDGKPTTMDIPPSDVIATADEPDHAVHRSLAQPRLAARRIAALEEPVRTWAVEALAPWLAAGGGDFVRIAEWVPARAVAHVLGLPDGDVSKHRAWAMMGGDMLAGDVGMEEMIAFGAEGEQMTRYMHAHLDATRENIEEGDGAPLLHALARGVQQGRIRRRDATGIAGVMFGAGGESTAGLIGSCVKRLASDAELAAQLRDDTSLIPRFVEEMVRLEPPFKFHYRAVRRPCQLGGYDLSPGDRLMLSWASANRDPARFEDPDVLRLDRRYPNQHLGFGRGAHFCIGAPLARLEARVIVEELLARTRSLGPGDGPPVYARSIFVRRLDSLPVRVEAV